MSRKIVFTILFLVSVAMLIDYLVIEPKSIDFVDGQLKEKFNGYVIYKNDQRGFYLYLANDPATVRRLHLDTLHESEAFNKPQFGGDIKHIISTNSLLYRASHIYDKIEKFPNSNKCLLSTKEGIFRFNCYIISRDTRETIRKIDEWQPNEIGLLKR